MNKMDFNEISMNGRLAYSIMCIERFLVNKYPNKNFKIFVKLLWNGTNTYWDTYSDYLQDLSKEFLFCSDIYDKDNFLKLNDKEFNYYRNLFDGIIDDIDVLVTNLHDITFAYAYEPITNFGKEITDVVFKFINLLKENKIKLPDINLVKFSNFKEKNGWGNEFDGTKLSIILNETKMP